VSFLHLLACSSPFNVFSTQGDSQPICQAVGTPPAVAEQESKGQQLAAADSEDHTKVEAVIVTKAGCVSSENNARHPGPVQLQLH